MNFSASEILTNKQKGTLIPVSEKVLEPQIRDENKAVLFKSGIITTARIFVSEKNKLQAIEKLKPSAKIINKGR